MLLIMKTIRNIEFELLHIHFGITNVGKKNITAKYTEPLIYLEIYCSKFSTGCMYDFTSECMTFESFIDSFYEAFKQKKVKH